MSLFYLFNPKMVIDPGWVGLSGSSGIKKPLIPVYEFSDKTQKNVEDLIKLSAKQAVLAKKIDKNTQNLELQAMQSRAEKMRTQIAEMEEEEHALIFLLLH